MKYTISRAARADLGSIWDYYAKESRSGDVADEVIRKLQAGVERIAKIPAIGRARADVENKRYLFWRVGSRTTSKKTWWSSWTELFMGSETSGESSADKDFRRRRSSDGQN